MTELRQIRMARIAGGLYLLQMATGVFGYLVRSRLTVPTDVAATARNIVEAETLFRVAIVTDIATFVAVISLCWVLFELLRETHGGLVRLGMALRLVENAVLCAWTTGLLLVLALLRGPVYQQALPQSDTYALARLLLSAQGQAHTVAFVLLGIGSAAFARALWKSRHVPPLLGCWGVVASLCLAAASAIIIVSPASAAVVRPPSFGAMGIYEVAVGAWLLLARGASTAEVNSRLGDHR